MIYPSKSKAYQRYICCSDTYVVALLSVCWNRPTCAIPRIDSFNMSILKPNEETRHDWQPNSPIHLLLVALTCRRLGDRLTQSYLPLCCFNLHGQEYVLLLVGIGRFPNFWRREIGARVKVIECGHYRTLLFEKYRR